jgi:DNA-binding winged helix-turn-helix (wHTH) protein
MNSLSEPFSQETLIKFLSPVINAINHNEHCSLLNLSKRDQVFRVKQIQENFNLILKYLQNHKEYKMVPIDLMSDLVEDKVDLFTLIDKNYNNKNYLVLFILEADILLNERQNLLAAFDSLQIRYPKLTIVYFFRKNILLPRFTNLYTKYHSLYQNIGCFTLLKDSDVFIYLKQLEQRFNCSIPKVLTSFIIENCSGHMWLIKQVVRSWIEKKDISQIENDPNLILRIKTIYEEFEPEEQKLLEKIAIGTKCFEEEEKTIINYLITIGYILKKKNLYKGTIRLLSNFMSKKAQSENILTLFNKKNIMVNKQIVDTAFSRRERILLKELIKEKGKLFTREQMAKIIWGQNYTDHYTDWGLDQFMRRLRQKIKQLQLNPKIIQTVKNKGYILQNI